MKPLIDRVKDLEAALARATGGGGSATVITGGVAGPQGPAGAAGPAGATGPAGAPGTTAGGLGVLPGGWATGTTTSGIGAAFTSVTGAQITVDVAANRLVRITGYAQVQQLTSAAFAELQIREVLNPGVTTEIQSAGHTFTAANQITALNPVVIVQPTPGTHTYQLQGSTTAGTLTVLGGIDPIVITAEDIGPFLGVVVPPNPPVNDAFTGTNGAAWASPWTTGTFTTGGHSGASTEDIQTNKGRMLLNGTLPGAGCGILDPAKGASFISDQEVYLEFTTQGTLGSWFLDLLVRDDGTAPTSSAQNAVGVRVDTAGSIQINSYVGGVVGTSSAKFVQANAPTAGNPVSPQTTVTVPFPGDNTAGNHIEVAISFANLTSTISSVVDTLGNTYAVANVLHRGTTLSQVTYYAENIAAGTNSVTVTFSGSTPFPDVFVCEHSGLLTSGSLDKVAAAHATSTAPDSGATATTAQANELLFGAISTNNGVGAAGAGYVIRCLSAPHTPAILNASGDAIESGAVAATGTYHATATTNGSAPWVAQVATFKAASSASTPVTIAASKTYGLRLRVQGLTYLAKCWDLTGTEPVAWMVQYNDLSGVTPTSGVVRVQLVPQGAGVSQRVDIDNFSRVDLSGNQVALPDLAVLSLVASPAAPNVGDEVSFTAVVSNVGSQVTPPGVKIDVGIYVDPPDISVNLVADDPSEVAWNDIYAPAAGLVPGGTQSLTTNSSPTGKATWTATAGTHSVYAVADTHNLITESAVTNVFLVSLPVTSPTTTGVDVIPTGITTSPVNPIAGDVITFGGVVLNQGDTATPSGVNIKGEWTVAGLGGTNTENNYAPSPGLAAGASATITANVGTFQIFTPATYPVTLTLDSGNILGDTHRTDKTLTVNITVAPAPTGRFPLKVSSNGRYLVDQQGNPFLLVADSPQGAFGQINLSTWTTWVADRKAKGFTAIYFDALVGHYTGGRDDGKAFDGTHAPFTVGTGQTTYDLSTPDISAGGYWVQFDAFVAAVQTAGLLAIIDPIELGLSNSSGNTTNLSWRTCLQNNGATKASTYGRFLGARYPNVLWQSGNDFGAPLPSASDVTLAQAVNDGIKASAPTALMTVEYGTLISGGVQAGGSLSTDVASFQSRVDLNAAYSYNPVYDVTLKGYAYAGTGSPKPVYLTESNYEASFFTYNFTAATVQSVRRVNWQTMTAGGCGFFYGSGHEFPVQIGGAGVDFSTGTVDTVGVTQIGYLVNLLAPRAWYSLVPDGGVNGAGATLIVSGRGTYATTGDPAASTWVTAAKTPDGTFALAYLPQGGSPVFNMAKMAGQTTARWYDPTAGTFKAIAGSPFANVGNKTFTAPGNNAGGNLDWVLVLEAVVGPPPTGNIAFGAPGHVNLAYGNLPAYIQELTLAKNAGATWCRVDIVGTDATADAIVKASRDLGLKLCATIGGSSKSISSATAAAIAARYGPSSTLKGINAVELLNEPNCGAGGAPLSGAAYWNLVSPCIAPIRNADPALPIWLGAICNGGSVSTQAWATQLVTASGTFPAGCHISFHDYGSWVTAFANIRTLLDANGMSDRLIHCTEDGYATTGGFNEAAQATYVTNKIAAWKASASSGAGVLIWYETRDVNSGDGVSYNNYGLYRTNFTAKAAVAAFTNGVTTP